MSTVNTVRRTRPVTKWALIVGGIVVVLIAAGFALNGTLSHMARERAMSSLRRSFASDLDLKHLSISVFPSVRVSGDGLTFRYHGRTDLPPLITVRRFTADGNLLSVLAGHIRRVRLEGLEVQVPPKSERSDQKKRSSSPHSDFVVDEVQADGAVVRTLPKDPNKDPLVWQIRKLTLTGASASSAMTFHATLTNAKPPGEIVSSGKFGPWNAEEPSETPVQGSYSFENADLSVFKGIAGTLSSTGNYHGVLERIEAQGKTDTPNFTLKVSGNPVHLTTQYQAVIDGTDGDTSLQPVTGQFGHSSVTARGSVAGHKGIPGKNISLDIVVERGRLEDMLHLATKGRKPSMTGAVSFHAKLVIPPGDVDVSQKTKLDGEFTVASAHFSELNVQEKVNELSHRGKGEPDAPPADTVASDFTGQFHLAHGVMTFPQLSFRVPGVRIALSGRYELANESMDFHGTAALEAKLSQTTTGFKSFLLKALDPIFSKKDAGAVIPIRISGTRDKPSFGLDLKPASSAKVTKP